MHRANPSDTLSPQGGRAQAGQQLGLTAVTQEPKLYTSAGGYSCTVNVSAVDIAAITSDYETLRTLLCRGDRGTFNVNLTQMNVSYQGANGTLVTKGLSELSAQLDANGKGFAAVQRMTSIAQRILPGASLTRVESREQLSELSGYKSLSQVPAMVRNHPALQKLPTSFSDCAAAVVSMVPLAQQDTALRRIAAVEVVVSPQLRIVQEQIQAAQFELMTTQNLSANKRRKLEKQIKDLSAFKDVDRFALYIAVAFAPTIDCQQVTDDEQRLTMARDAAQVAFDTLYEQLSNENVRAWIPEDSYLSLFRGTPDSSPELKAYCADAAALIFSILPSHLARSGAHEFWEKHQSSSKRHTFEDETMRMALSKNLGIVQLPLAELMLKTFEEIDRNNPKGKVFEKSKGAFKKASEFKEGTINNADNHNLLVIPANTNPTIKEKIALIDTKITSILPPPLPPRQQQGQPPQQGPSANPSNPPRPVVESDDEDAAEPLVVSDTGPGAEN